MRQPVRGARRRAVKACGRSADAGRGIEIGAGWLDGGAARVVVGVEIGRSGGDTPGTHLEADICNTSISKREND